MTARLTAGAARRGEENEGGGEKVREEEGEVGGEGAGKQQGSRAAAASASQLKYVCSYFAFAFVAVVVVVVFHVVASTEVVLFGRTRHGAARSQCLRSELPRPVQLRPAAFRLAHLPAHFVVPLMKIN